MISSSFSHTAIICIFISITCSIFCYGQENQAGSQLKYEVDGSPDDPGLAKPEWQLADEEQETHANNLTEGCSSQCSVSYDKNLDCWTNNLHYFEKILLGVMRRYTTNQINRAIWDFKHGISTDYEWRRKESVRRMTMLPPPKIRDANKKVGEKVLRRVIFPLMDNARVEAEYIIRHFDNPPKKLHCPRACERHWDPFMWLFIVSCVLTLILGTSVICMVWLLDRRENQFITVENQEYGENAKVVVIENPLGEENSEARAGTNSPFSNQKENAHSKKSIETRSHQSASTSSNNSSIVAMSKRPNKKHSLDEKQAVIEAAKKNSNNTELAKQFNMPRSTIQRILKNKEATIKAIEDSAGAKRARLRPVKNDDLESALLDWIKSVRSQNVAVTGHLITEKAKELAALLGVEDFKGSSGWLEKFQKRHAISLHSEQGEAGNINVSCLTDWQQHVLQEALAEYSPEDVFNADETGLFWKMLPSKTLAFKGEKCTSGKKSKERITVLVGANMSGTQKLPLLVIGKLDKPRCFKNVQVPIEYTANKKHG